MTINPDGTVCATGVEELAFEYDNGWERFARYSTCGLWIDQYWSAWQFEPADYDYWGNQEFGPMQWPARGY